MPSRIIIDRDYCKGCLLCREVCPRGVFAPSDERNPRGYLLPAAAQPENCTGCGLCEVICPDLALTVLPPQKEAAHAPGD